MTDRQTLDQFRKAFEIDACDSTSIVQASIAAARDPAGQGPIAFLSVDDEVAIEMAMATDRLRRAGCAPSPFAGLPVAIKDLFDVEGQGTRAGSLHPVAATAVKDATVVASLRAAGLIPLGRTNMTEFAFSGLGLNPHYGTPLSPWRRDEGRIAGGSTSGGAVAVADGMVPAALGSDTGGSCRIPAAFCGLVGFKPTAQRISRAGMVPLSTSLDSVGWIANSVACCVEIDTMLTGDARDPVSVSLSGLRLAIPAQLVLDDVDADVGAAFDNACAALSSRGAHVTKVDCPSLLEIGRMNAGGGFTAAESFAWHRLRPSELLADYDPRVLSRIERGRMQSAADYIDLLSARSTLQSAFAAEIAGFDAVLFPTVPILPPRLDTLLDDDSFTRINLLVLRNSTIVNMIDGCAISLPIGDGASPVGLSLACLNGDDHRLLAIACAVEACFQ